MSFSQTERTPAGHAQMRAEHDVRFTPDRVLTSWLTEFAYLRYPSPENVRTAFRVARAERGLPRLAHELQVHEARMRDRTDIRCARELACRS